jgi:hypothetical protein
MKLFYVRAHDGNGCDLDLLVRAESDSEARAAWLEHFETDPAGNDPPVALSLIEWVGEIPDTPAAGVIPWDTVKGCPACLDGGPT